MESDHEVIEELYVSDQSEEFDEIEVEEEYSISETSEEIMDFDLDESSRDLSYKNSDKSIVPDLSEHIFNDKLSDILEFQEFNAFSQVG